MGNIAAASNNVIERMTNIDSFDMDLQHVDESKIRNVQNKSVRSTKEYKALRKKAREGIRDAEREILWTKATSASTEDAQRYKELCSELFSDIAVEDFPHFPLFGSQTTFEIITSAIQNIEKAKEYHLPTHALHYTKSKNTSNLSFAHLPQEEPREQPPKLNLPKPTKENYIEPHNDSDNNNNSRNSNNKSPSVSSSNKYIRGKNPLPGISEALETDAKATIVTNNNSKKNENDKNNENNENKMEIKNNDHDQTTFDKNSKNKENSSTKKSNDHIQEKKNETNKDNDNEKEEKKMDNLKFRSNSLDNIGFMKSERDTLMQEKLHQMHAAQRILLVLAVEHDSLKYCPQLPYVTEFCLQYIKEENVVFSIVNALIKTSKHNNWYFRTDQYNTKIRLKTFMSIFGGAVKPVAQHCRAKKLNVEDILEDAIESMFIEYFTLETTLRLYDTFMVEGYKILFRAGVALLNHCQDYLLKCTSIESFQKVLIKQGKKVTPKEFCSFAFEIHLQRKQFAKLDTFHRKQLKSTMLDNVDKEVSYVRRWPQFDSKTMSKSSILGTDKGAIKAQFLQLWVWLPPGCHLGDFNLLFSTNDDGYQLSKLYLKCEDHDNLIILIRTISGDTFGAFLSNLGDELPATDLIRDPKISLFKLSKQGSKSNKIYQPDSTDYMHLHHQPTPSRDFYESLRTGKSLDLIKQEIIEVENESKNNNEMKTDNDKNEKKTKNKKSKNGNEEWVVVSPTSQKKQKKQRALTEDLSKKSPNKSQSKDQHSGSGRSESVGIQSGKKTFPVVHPTSHYLAIGDGNVQAIYIDDSLNHGFSNPCKTFDSPILVSDTNGEFQINAVEVWSVE